MYFLSPSAVFDVRTITYIKSSFNPFIFLHFSFWADLVNSPCACAGWAHRTADCCRPARPGSGPPPPAGWTPRRPRLAHGRAWSCQLRAAAKAWTDWTGRWARTSSSSLLRNCCWTGWRVQRSHCPSTNRWGPLRRWTWRDGGGQGRGTKKEGGWYSNKTMEMAWDFSECALDCFATKMIKKFLNL